MSSIKLSAILRSWSSSSSSVLICWSLLTDKGVEKFRLLLTTVYMTCLCSRYNLRSDRLTLGHYFPIMSTGQLQVSKNQAKNHIVNFLLTSNIPFNYRKISNLGIAIMTSPWLSQYAKGLSLRFSCKDFTMLVFLVYTVRKVPVHAAWRSVLKKKLRYWQ